MADNVVEAALAYAALGWPVLACYTATEGACACSLGKECKSPGKHPRPDLCPKGFNDATTDVKVITEWPKDINIAVRLGKAAKGLMVVDVDDRDAARMLLDANVGLSDQTGVVFTGRAGCHIYFRCTGLTHTYHIYTKDKKRLGEVRGDNAYVVIPPSTGAFGRDYRWIGRRPSDPVPRPEAASDSMDYAVALFALVGIEVEADKDLAQPTNVPVPDDPIYEAEIPTEITSHTKLLRYRQVLQGGLGTLDASAIDRSGALQGFAFALKEAAEERGYPLTVEQIAGCLKHYDTKAWNKPKFGDRDVEYMRSALKVLPERAVAVAPSAPATQQQAPVLTSDYLFDKADGWLYYTGGRSARKVCNFDPVIEEEYEIDPGAGADPNDTKGRIFFVKFTHLKGRPAEFFLSNEDMSSNNRLETALERECSSSFVVAPSMFSHLKAALKSQSTPRRSKVFKCSGWVEHGSGWVYLLPGAQGGIGMAGMDTSVKIDREKISEETIAVEQLSTYGRGVRPPSNDSEKMLAWQAFETLITSAPARVSVPIMLQVLAGPLTSAGADESPPVVHVMGMTGSLKTSFCMAALSMFGTFDASPASWTASPTYRSLFLYALKDVTLLLDDYKRSTVGGGVKGTKEFIQNYADRTTRGRASPTQKVQTTKIPRGLLLSNGEDRWEKEGAAEARTILIGFDRKEMDPPKLALAQAAVREGHLQWFGGAYLQWLAGQHDILAGGEFKRVRQELHNRLLTMGKGKDIHLRIFASLATLLATAQVVSRFIKDEWSEAARDSFMELVNDASSALILGVDEHAKEVEESSPFTQLRRAIGNKMAAGDWCLAPDAGLSAEHHKLPDKPKADVCGYYLTQSEPLEVLLTRDTTFARYEKEHRSRGSDGAFTWDAVVREAVSNYGAVKGDRIRIVTGKGKKGEQQLSGVVIPLDAITLTDVKKIAR